MFLLIVNERYLAPFQQLYIRVMCVKLIKKKLKYRLGFSVISTTVIDFINVNSPLYSDASGPKEKRVVIKLQIECVASLESTI